MSAELGWIAIGVALTLAAEVCIVGGLLTVAVWNASLQKRR